MSTLPRDLREAVVFEIGYGPRPYRLLALRAMGVDVRGVDAEVPVLSGRPSELRAAYAANGLERLTKSLVRRAMFDWRENLAFHRALRAAGLACRASSVSGCSLPTRRSSSCVLAARSRLLRGRIRTPASRRDQCAASSNGCLAEARRAGADPSQRVHGHYRRASVEWNRRSLLTGHPRERRTGPWDHLLVEGFRPTPTSTASAEPNTADGSPNISRSWPRRSTLPDLGREFLTGPLRERLADYPEDELFSNEVRFVLRPRPADSSATSA